MALPGLIRASGDVQDISEYRAICSTFPCRNAVVGELHLLRERAQVDLRLHIAETHSNVFRAVALLWARRAAPA